jgi:alpha-mannosidase
LHARRYVETEFETRPKVCWEPDTFGHAAAFPQLLAQSGVQFYYFCRAGKRYPLFWWEGPDGSRVLACQDPNGYNGEVRPGSVVDAMLDFTRPAGIRRGLLVYGVGDHGGSGTARDIEAARRLDADALMPRILPSTAGDFYEMALSDLDGGPGRDSLPVVRGELNTVFEGCYTSHGDIKRLNREAENALLTAETLAALAKLHDGAEYPADSLAEAWRTTCFHQFHDILCGCAIGVTYQEANEAMSEVLRTAAAVTAKSAGVLAIGLIGGENPGPRIVVLNPLAWTRSDVVRVPLSSLPLGRWGSVMDDRGDRLPAQIADGCLLFVARDIPGLGARAYTPSEHASEEARGVRVNGERTLESDLFEMRVNVRSGAIDRLVDKANARSLAGPVTGWGPEAKVNAGMLNRLQVLWEQPHPMSAWNIGDITRIENLIDGAHVQIAEGGPVRGVIEVKRPLLHSTLRQRIMLYNGLPRIDFETEIDWHEKGSAHHDAPMLRATFTPHLGRTTATFETGYVAVERPADGREVPALRWADLSEGNEYGLSLLNDGKYGHSAQGNTLGLTLVRASYEPDVNPDEGIHRFTYALYPHAGDWRSANTPERAAELNQPLIALVADAGMARPQRGIHGFEIESEHSARWPGKAILSAVKLAEDQPADAVALVLRLYEVHGKRARAAIRVPGRLLAAQLMNPIERVVQPRSTPDTLSARKDRVRIRFQPHEVVTIRLVTSPS